MSVDSMTKTIEVIGKDLATNSLEVVHNQSSTAGLAQISSLVRYAKINLFNFPPLKLVQKFTAFTWLHP